MANRYETNIWRVGIEPGTAFGTAGINAGANALNEYAKGTSTQHQLAMQEIGKNNEVMSKGYTLVDNPEKPGTYKVEPLPAGTIDYLRKRNEQLQRGMPTHTDANGEASFQSNIFAINSVDPLYEDKRKAYMAGDELAKSYMNQGVDVRDWFVHNIAEMRKTIDAKNARGEVVTPNDYVLPKDNALILYNRIQDYTTVNKGKRWQEFEGFVSDYNNKVDQYNTTWANEIAAGKVLRMNKIAADEPSYRDYTKDKVFTELFGKYEQQFNDPKVEAAFRQAFDVTENYLSRTISSGNLAKDYGEYLGFYKPNYEQAIVGDYPKNDYQGYQNPGMYNGYNYNNSNWYGSWPNWQVNVPLQQPVDPMKPLPNYRPQIQTNNPWMYNGFNFFPYPRRY